MPSRACLGASGCGSVPARTCASVRACLLRVRLRLPCALAYLCARLFTSVRACALLASRAVRAALAAAGTLWLCFLLRAVAGGRERTGCPSGLHPRLAQFVLRSSALASLLVQYYCEGSNSRVLAVPYEALIDP